MDLGGQAARRRRGGRLELTGEGALAVVSPTTITAARWGVVAVLAVIAAVQLRRHPIPPVELLRRVPRCIAGLCCYGIGIAVFFAARGGNPPWDVFHGGLSARTGVPVGLVINLVGIALLVLWIPLKERVGLGTVLNALVIGEVVDLVRPQLGNAHSVALQVTMVFVATLVIGLGSGLYIGAGIGAGPRDGLMLGLSRMGLSIRTSRWLIEAVTLCVGWLLGGRIGFGTVAFPVLIGPVVQYLLPRMSLPALADQVRRSHRGLIGEHYRS